MDLLDILPSQDGYAVRDAASSDRTALKGGLSRTRRDLISSSYIVDVKWRLNLTRYETLRAFHDAHVGDAFLMDLIIDEPTLTRHSADFIPGSFQLDGVEGSTYTVTAVLEVVPLPVDVDMDEILMLLFETYGETEGGTASLMFALEQLVNVDMPASM